MPRAGRHAAGRGGQHRADGRRLLIGAPRPHQRPVRLAAVAGVGTEAPLPRGPCRRRLQDGHPRGQLFADCSPTSPGCNTQRNTDPAGAGDRHPEPPTRLQPAAASRPPPEAPFSTARGGRPSCRPSGRPCTQRSAAHRPSRHWPARQASSQCGYPLGGPPRPSAPPPPQRRKLHRSCSAAACTHLSRRGLRLRERPPPSLSSAARSRSVRSEPPGRLRRPNSSYLLQGASAAVSAGLSAQESGEGAAHLARAHFHTLL